MLDAAHAEPIQDPQSLPCDDHGRFASTRAGSSSDATRDRRTGGNRVDLTQFIDGNQRLLAVLRVFVAVIVWLKVIFNYLTMGD